MSTTAIVGMRCFAASAIAGCGSKMLFSVLRKMSRSGRRVTDSKKLVESVKVPMRHSRQWLYSPHLFAAASTRWPV